MIKSNKIGKSVSLLLGRAGVGFLFLAFSACSTVQNVPIDDAYYSPEVEKGDLPTPSIPVTHVNQTTQTTPNTPTTPTTPTTQSIEYLNVQDTTVTIRIK